MKVNKLRVAAVTAALGIGVGAACALGTGRALVYGIQDALTRQTMEVLQSGGLFTT
jgi:hypothetical protein